MNFPFLKEEKIKNRTQKTFTGKILEIYIPEDYFKSGLARQIGENIESIGLLIFTVEGVKYRLSMPIKFLFGFSDKRKWSGKIKSELPSDDYFIYTLVTGDAFCYDVNKVQTINDIIFFMNKLIEGAKIPKTTPYGDIHGLMLNAMISSKNIGLGVTSTAFEILIAELCRNRNNPTEAFRFNINKNPKNEYGYRSVKTTKIAELTSTFAGIMGEDSKHQIIAGITFNREGREELESPMEKLIKY